MLDQTINGGGSDFGMTIAGPQGIHRSNENTVVVNSMDPEQDPIRDKNPPHPRLV